MKIAELSSTCMTFLATQVELCTCIINFNLVTISCYFHQSSRLKVYTSISPGIASRSTVDRIIFVERIFRGAYISRISLISLHSRKLITAKILGSLHDRIFPCSTFFLWSYIWRSTSISRKLPVHYQIQTVLSLTVCHPEQLISSANREVSSLVSQDTAKIATRGKYTSYSAEEKLIVAKRAAEFGVTSTLRFFQSKSLLIVP